MKIKVTTIYESVDQQWLDWYLKRLSDPEAFPGAMQIAKDLEEYGQASFSTDDPTSKVIGTTEYLIVRDAN